MISKRDTLLAALPLDIRGAQLRRWTRRDLEKLAAWPDYPFPYHGFEFSFRGASCKERDHLFAEREADVGRVVLVVESPTGQLIAYFALIDVDWQRGAVGGCSIRIHPDHWGRGLGTELLRTVVRWALSGPLHSLTLDVAASNQRAIRCYKKVGFVIVEEFWRPLEFPPTKSASPDLAAIDLNREEYAFLKPHVRTMSGVRELRFFRMRHTQDDPPVDPPSLHG